MSEMKFAEASLKSLKISPIKLQKFVRALTGMPVEEAMKILTFSNVRVANDIRMLLKSAMANAENNNNMDIDTLSIHRIYAGKAFVMKRFRARARGRGTRILKPFCNLRVVLTGKEA